MILINHAKIRYVMLAILFLSGCGQAANKGEIAPNFTLNYLVGSETMTLHKLKGQVVYLDFWASWCKPCIQSFPELDKLHKQYQSQGFTVVAVNLDQKPELAKAFLTEHAVAYPVLYDEGAEIAKLYGVNSMPSSYFIDKKGVLRLAHKGFFPGDEIKIEKAIKLLLAE